MLESYLKRLHNKELYQRQIEATDRQIDALVYELYGLTSHEGLSHQHIL